MLETGPIGPVSFSRDRYPSKGQIDAAATGQPDRAALLFGGSQALLDSAQDDSDLAQLPAQRDAERRARLALGETDYAQRYAEGYSLPASGAVRYALTTGPPGERGHRSLTPISTKRIGPHRTTECSFCAQAGRQTD